MRFSSILVLAAILLMGYAVRANLPECPFFIATIISAMLIILASGHVLCVVAEKVFAKK